MVTLEYLYKVYEDANNTAKTTTDIDVRRESYRMIDCSKGAIEYLEANNLTEIEIIGPFYNGLEKDERLKVRGTKIRIKKGAKIRSTGPQNGTIAKRDRVVTLFDFDPGYCCRSAKFEEFRNAKVCWVGSSGYWFYTDLNNVEIICQEVRT